MSNDERARAIPRHIAIIMDGNGRWASRRHLPRFAGHRAGVRSVKDSVRLCGEFGVDVLTLFAFSSENWSRPQEEVGLLMGLFLSAFQHEVKELHENGVRLRVIGDCAAFNSELQQNIRNAEALTENNTGLQLFIAANYGGRWDIVNAAQRIARRVEAGELNAAEVDQETFAGELSLAGIPEPDLFIRTGGEVRISNFLLWDLAYTELFFTDTLWPDFARDDFEVAIAEFRGRQRRFGRTGEQIKQTGSTPAAAPKRSSGADSSDSLGADGPSIVATGRTRQ